MPNWCENKLTVIGDNEDLTVFKDHVKGTGTDMCLNNIVPMPKELYDTTSPGDDDNWYNWRIRNWGIKWDIDASLIGESDNILIYEFDSPWAPPHEWVRNAALIFPDLSFELYYREPGMCFQGTILAQKDLFINHEDDYVEDIDLDEEEFESDDSTTNDGQNILNVINIDKRE